MEIFKKHLVLSERKNGLRELRSFIKIRAKMNILILRRTYASWISVNKEFDTNILR
ncbi:MAG: hypothetical protein Ct9H90mP20_6650 [Candidatus Neomarinimicrobiota bacterium]|nr:MAG: hypothetical protein Ct9H90mP20_6650 [Candidatus Neomarinimicrobiota bacterium]